MTDFTKQAEELVKTWRGDGCYTGTYYELAAQVAAALRKVREETIDEVLQITGGLDCECLGPDYACSVCAARDRILALKGRP